MNTDQVLLEYKQKEKSQQFTEEIIGAEDQVGLDGEATKDATSTDGSPTTCTKCKTLRIATATAEIVPDVTQSASIISTGDASSTAPESKSGAVVEIHRTWFAVIVGLFALAWIL